MSFHLHIKGRVQGVGFRPHVYKHARRKNIAGYVSNENDGVHVIFNNSSAKDAKQFAETIISKAPPKAVIQNWSLKEVDEEIFEEFSIRVLESEAQPDLLISPDFALCPQCRKEFHDTNNRRYHYPFITCTLCGPRYSIMKRLPYERHLTVMEEFSQCAVCREEYDNPNDRRYFSQTNSCGTCGIQLSWHSRNSSIITDPKEILLYFLNEVQNGKIIAVKGIGGYLLMCDAANREAIQTLRRRKHRPLKPFAVLFPNIAMVQQFAETPSAAIDSLLGETSPIVLLRAKKECFHKLDMDGIAPGLSSIGVMIPYAPILEWITSEWKHPLIATSGNLSGSCIVFQSEKKEKLFEFADFILDHNREIVIPQDDSVVRFCEVSDQQITLRRSRGLAPAIILPYNIESDESIFAAGAMLKSTFAIQHNHQIYLSQFLGNLESYDAQHNYQHTLHHFEQLLEIKPRVALADLHPDYPSTKIAEEISEELDIPIKKIQHHEAHFAAILGEHNLFDSNEKILGVIWDGTGLGSDGNIWGGEFFIYEEGTIERIHFLEPFNNVAGDKTALEPRLSAFAITQDIENASSFLQSKFSKQEWSFYQKLVAESALKNSSAGRYFDAVASLLDLVNINSYEGEGGLLLEQFAYRFLSERNFETANHYLDEPITDRKIPMKNVMRHLIDDLKSGKSKAEIAARFHQTLAIIIQKVTEKTGVKKVAFSGGVFQNAVLVDFIHLKMSDHCNLYFHQQMPPNDECIAFGQLMHYLRINTNAEVVLNSTYNNQ